VGRVVKDYFAGAANKEATYPNWLTKMGLSPPFALMTSMNNAIVTYDRNYTRWLRSRKVTFRLSGRAVAFEDGHRFFKPLP
jgi:hypothetical protein